MHKASKRVNSDNSLSVSSIKCWFIIRNFTEHIHEEHISVFIKSSDFISSTTTLANITIDKSLKYL